MQTGDQPPQFAGHPRRIIRTHGFYVVAVFLGKLNKLSFVGTSQ